MAEESTRTRSVPVRHLHLKVRTGDLIEFARHVATHVRKEIVDHVPGEDKSAELYIAVRTAVEEELREHVMAMDLCGLSALCGEAAEYDAWPEATGLPTGFNQVRK